MDQRYMCPTCRTIPCTTSFYINSSEINTCATVEICPLRIGKIPLEAGQTNTLHSEAHTSVPLYVCNVHKQVTRCVLNQCGQILLLYTHPSTLHEAYHVRQHVGPTCLSIPTDHPNPFLLIFYQTLISCSVQQN